MSDLLVWDWCPVAVHAAHQVRDHVCAFGFIPAGEVVLFAGFASRLDDLEVDLAHTSVCFISLAVVGERGPGEHEVYRGEAEVKVVEELGELGGHFGADFFALEGASCCEDGYLGHGSGEVNSTGLAFEVGG